MSLVALWGHWSLKPRRSGAPRDMAGKPTSPTTNPNMTTTTLQDLDTPAFIVNRHAIHENCNKVRTVAYANGIHHLRPHVKTHKTKEGCLIQAGMGGDGRGGKDGAITDGMPASNGETTFDMWL